jgi:hypothetical protein
MRWGSAYEFKLCIKAKGESIGIHLQMPLRMKAQKFFLLP